MRRNELRERGATKIIRKSCIYCAFFAEKDAQKIKGRDSVDRYNRRINLKWGKSPEEERLSFRKVDICYLFEDSRKTSYGNVATIYRINFANVFQLSKLRRYFNFLFWESINFLLKTIKNNLNFISVKFKFRYFSQWYIRCNHLKETPNNDLNSRDKINLKNMKKKGWNYLCTALSYKSWLSSSG